MALLNANFVICEKILREADGVLSIVRIVEIFTVTLHPEVDIEQQRILCFCWANLQFSPDDEDEHTASLTITRPSGEVKDIPFFQDQRMTASTFEGMPKSANILMQLAITPKEFGIHNISLIVDGARVATTRISLLKQQVLEPAQNSVR